MPAHRLRYDTRRGSGDCERTVGANTSGAATSPAREDSLAYDCGNKFWVRNGNPSPVQVTYEVEGTPEWITISVPNAAHGADYSEVGVWTFTKGTVRLLFNNSVIQVEANGDRACDRP